MATLTFEEWPVEVGDVCKDCAQPIVAVTYELINGPEEGPIFCIICKRLREREEVA